MASWELNLAELVPNGINKIILFLCFYVFRCLSSFFSHFLFILLLFKPSIYIFPFTLFRVSTTLYSPFLCFFIAHIFFFFSSPHDCWFVIFNHFVSLPNFPPFTDIRGSFFSFSNFSNCFNRYLFYFVPPNISFLSACSFHEMISFCLIFWLP